MTQSTTSHGLMERQVYRIVGSSGTKAYPALGDYLYVSGWQLGLKTRVRDSTQQTGEYSIESILIPKSLYTGQSVKEGLS
jgi:hypothetical protein